MKLPSEDNDFEKQYGEIKGEYNYNSGQERIKQFFFDNVGKVVTTEQLQEVASMNHDRRYENWHQRLSELRTDKGYTILSRRDRDWLNQGEYVMPHKEQADRASKRTYIEDDTLEEVLERADYACEWPEGCDLSDGDIDPVSGGKVELQPDHKIPHDSDKQVEPDNPDHWQALCGRHQVMKKNYWDDTTGKLNYYAIVQSAPKEEKEKIYDYLQRYFGDKADEWMEDDNSDGSDLSDFK
jgi:hypothetical protein